MFELRKHRELSDLFCCSEVVHLDIPIDLEVKWPKSTCVATWATKRHLLPCSQPPAVKWSAPARDARVLRVGASWAWGAEAEVVEGMGLEGPVRARADGRLVGTFHVHAPLRIFSSNGRKRDPELPQDSHRGPTVCCSNQKLAESRSHLSTTRFEGTCVWCLTDADYFESHSTLSLL